MPIELRPHQQAAADAVEAALSQGIRRPLVNMCVAAGKSLTYAELARRALFRGQRTIIGSHTRELVEQNAEACRDLIPNAEIGINAAALDRRDWRGDIICFAVQSVYKRARMLGRIDNMIVDEAHLVAHTETGMYLQMWNDLGRPNLIGGSGTTYRMMGGSLVEGEGAPFDREVYVYSILNGIRDGYLVPPVSLETADNIDPSKLKTRNGEYTEESQDSQMIAMIDNHIMQMQYHGQDRRSWLIFEASTKAAHAMCERMNQWGIPTGLVLGKTPNAERRATIQAYREGRLRALVNLNALTTGFSVQETDLLVMRRRTKSRGLYEQMLGRCLRAIGGHIDISRQRGKIDAHVLDFAGNIEQHGALDDLIVSIKSKVRFTLCDSCGKRNPSGALRCWGCDETLMKNCPACLTAIPRDVVDCPHCGFDMRSGTRDPSGKLNEHATGAALLSAHRKGVKREGGWIPIRFAWEDAVDDGEGNRWELPEHLKQFAASARWIRPPPNLALLIPNGASRTSVQQVMANGNQLLVPMPPVVI